MYQETRVYGNQRRQYKEIYILGFVGMRIKQPFVKFRLILFRVSKIRSQAALQRHKGRILCTAELDESSQHPHAIVMRVNLCLCVS
jgi:hypothetical protein